MRPLTGDLDHGSLAGSGAEAQLMFEERLGHQEVEIVFPTVSEVLLKRTKNGAICTVKGEDLSDFFFFNNESYLGNLFFFN